MITILFYLNESDQSTVKVEDQYNTAEIVQAIYYITIATTLWHSKRTKEKNHLDDGFVNEGLVEIDKNVWIQLI